MTPGARVQAAIECLDRIAEGQAAEQALLRWSRGARHAGSKDRAAVRDHVFDVLRRWWSTAAIGGGESGRARMIGLLRLDGHDTAAFFTGRGYDPAPIDEIEAASGHAPDPLAALDCPTWLADDLRSAFGEDFAPIMTSLQSRAPLFLRANLARTDREAAMEALARDGVASRAHDLSPTAIEVIDNPRMASRTTAFRDGLVEIQDAASQAVVDAIPLDGVGRILDYCAGGGGKSLALAARTDATIHAHDVAPERMRDIAPRAARSGVRIDVLGSAELRKQAPYDLVVVDAPCSGSGAWRRSPEGKIRFDRAELERLLALQREILERACTHVAPGGLLAYATCSLLPAENEMQISHLLNATPLAELKLSQSWTPLDGGDGFHLSVLQLAT
ncbi:16S rRNA (cytosine967-C5)-methyltransferase [Palleronia aestuarii]|uniref:16S rRNA (Cytosine967-C5)-methyltransferase n=1 Tax=Palleronia aestuarii TaxID=568105 RepID=A0A2W7NDH3_9RHOB|nr:RsmB/NOP family class I SAM-dependent RNA methyltransferase [Palleronia aestuarii]PZX18451.1 16S rRNA (cytosine967-C5)-methyltransferase [Palleronia aestuarii]